MQLLRSTVFQFEKLTRNAVSIYVVTVVDYLAGFTNPENMNGRLVGKHGLLNLEIPNWRDIHKSPTIIHHAFWMFSFLSIPDIVCRR